MTYSIKKNITTYKSNRNALLKVYRKLNADKPTSTIKGVITYLKLRQDLNLFELSNDLLFSKARISLQRKGEEAWSSVLDSICGKLLDLATENQHTSQKRSSSSSRRQLIQIVNYGKKIKTIRDIYNPDYTM